MIETAVYTRLSTFAGLAALVSLRIYPNIMPQNTTMPACVYNVVSAQREKAMTPVTVMTTKRIQVNSYGTTYASAKAVSEQVRAALQWWHGTVSGVVVHYSELQNDMDFYDDAAFLHGVMNDFLITFTEA